MKILLIRHGEPSYQKVTEKKFIGHGRDLAELSINGMEQAEIVSKDSRLNGSEIIISSPYTRALQTAGIISKNTGLNVLVETDLHEWLPDVLFQYDSEEHVISSLKEMKAYGGIHKNECLNKWEDIYNVKKRVCKTFQKYLFYQKVIVVTHLIVIRQFTNEKKIPFCGLIEMDY